MTALEAILLTWREEVNVLLRKSARHDYDQLDRTVYEVEARRLRDCADDLAAVLRAARSSEEDLDVKWAAASEFIRNVVEALGKPRPAYGETAPIVDLKAIALEVVGQIEELKVQAERAARSETPADYSQDLDYVTMLNEAKSIVNASPLHRRFINHTPLENDIAVWMADFALDVVRRVSERIREAAPPSRGETLPTAEEVRGILAEYRDAGADEVHELPATSLADQDAQDVTELALFPERYKTVVDHYREMARRFAESRDELKHRCRALEAELAASRAPKEPTLDISTASGTQMRHPTDPTICWQGKPNDLTAGRCTFTKGHDGPHQWDSSKASGGAEEVHELPATSGGETGRPALELIEAVEAAVAFLSMVEWTDRTTEDDATNVKHQLEAALEDARRSSDGSGRPA